MAETRDDRIFTQLQSLAVTCASVQTEMREAIKHQREWYVSHEKRDDERFEAISRRIDSERVARDSADQSGQQLAIQAVDAKVSAARLADVQGQLATMQARSFDWKKLAVGGLISLALFALGYLARAAW